MLHLALTDHTWTDLYLCSGWTEPERTEMCAAAAFCHSVSERFTWAQRHVLCNRKKLSCATKTVGLSAKKCGQCFRRQKADNSPLHAGGGGVSDPTPPSPITHHHHHLLLRRPGHVDRVHLPSSAWQNKHRNHIKAAEPGRSAPVDWFVILLQRLITVGIQRAGCPSVRNLKVKVWNSCQAKWKNKQTNQSAQR